MSTGKLNYLEANCRLAQQVADRMGKKISVRWYASDKKRCEVINGAGWTIFEGTPREAYIFLMGMVYYAPADEVQALQDRCERAVSLAPDFWE